MSTSTDMKTSFDVGSKIVIFSLVLYFLIQQKAIGLLLDPIAVIFFAVAA